MLLFAKAKALHSENRTFLINNATRHLTEKDKKFFSQLHKI